MIMPGSCSRGFRSRPCAAAGSRRSKGLEVNSVKDTKPALIQPSTPTTRAMKASGRWRLNTVTATVQPDSASAHSSSEPS